MVRSNTLLADMIGHKLVFFASCYSIVPLTLRLLRVDDKFDCISAAREHLFDCNFHIFEVLFDCNFYIVEVLFDCHCEI